MIRPNPIFKVYVAEKAATNLVVTAHRHPRSSSRESRCAKSATFFQQPRRRRDYRLSLFRCPMLLFVHAFGSGYGCVSGAGLGLASPAPQTDLLGYRLGFQTGSQDPLASAACAQFRAAEATPAVVLDLDIDRTAPNQCAGFCERLR
jgi:hypothetical protein